MAPFTEPDPVLETAGGYPGPQPHTGDEGWGKLMQLVPVQSSHVQGAAFDGETVLFDLRTGRSYRLNSIGTAVWERCTGTATLHEIHRAVCASLSLPMEGLHEDVVTFVAQWSHDGLVSQAETAKR